VRTANALGSSGHGFSHSRASLIFASLGEGPRAAKNQFKKNLKLKT
jgi:hypothetical protein